MSDPQPVYSTEGRCEVEMRSGWLILFDGDGNQAESMKCESTKQAKAALIYWWFDKGHDWFNFPRCRKYVQKHFARIRHAARKPA